MTLLARWRRRRTATPPTRDEVVGLLRAAEKDKARADRYQPNPNEGYATPDRSLPPPPGVGAP